MQVRGNMRTGKPSPKRGKKYPKEFSRERANEVDAPEVKAGDAIMSYLLG